jgi:hypothetical protein
MEEGEENKKKKELKPRGLISSGEDSLRSFDGGWGM